MSLTSPLALSNATANWVMGENEDQWIITGNDSVELWKFPKKWKVEDCMTAIRMGRKYELEAFNRGIEYGKEEARKQILPHVERRDLEMKALMERNELLSSKLLKLISGDED